MKLIITGNLSKTTCSPAIRPVIMTLDKQLWALCLVLSLLTCFERVKTTPNPTLLHFSLVLPFWNTNNLLANEH